MLLNFVLIISLLVTDLKFLMPFFYKLVNVPCSFFAVFKKPNVLFKYGCRIKCTDTFYSSVNPNNSVDPILE